MPEIKQSGKKTRRQRTMADAKGGDLIFALLSRYMGPIFERKRLAAAHRSSKAPVKIFKVVGVTPGRRHYLCETNVGILRKPAGSVPERLHYDFELLFRN